MNFTNHHVQNGQTRKVRTHLQDDQIRYDTHPLELQHVPFGATLVHLRVRKVQAEDLPAMHSESIIGMTPHHQDYARILIIEQRRLQILLLVSSGVQEYHTGSGGYFAALRYPSEESRQRCCGWWKGKGNRRDRESGLD